MNIKELSNISLSELQDALGKGAVSPVEIVELTLEQADSVNDEINALYDLRHDQATEEAKASEKRYQSGNPISPFDGVPVTLKDSVNAVGMKWFHGTVIHGDTGIVGQKDSPPAARLKEAGAIIIGKAAMPDFGLSGSGVSGSHGIVRNPWGLYWSTGGSSAGGGASLASGIGMMSVGSDIAGSVRLPAGHCGLAALKPTQGAIPHAPASNVRSAGPITRSAADLKAWTILLNGPDNDDRYSVPLNGYDPEDKPRIGASADFGFGPEVEPAVLKCFETVKAILAGIAGPVKEVAAKANFDAYLPIDDSLKIKGWQEYQSADECNRGKTPDELYKWFKEAEHWTPTRMAEVSKGIERGVAYCVALFADIDILLTPVMPVVNFPATDRGIDPSMPLRHTTFTALFNQSGNPAVAICGGFDQRGLPIGMQLVGRRFDDLRLLDLAARLEAALGLIGAGRRNWPTRPVACAEAARHAG